MNRVVVTGMSVVSALGNDWHTFEQGLRLEQNAVKYMPDWQDVEDLGTRIAAPVEFVKPAHFSRKKVRSMGRVSLMATAATEQALQQAHLTDDPVLTNGSTGIAYGSSTGSTQPLTAFGNLIANRSMSGVTATSYIQMMAHTTAVNLGVYFSTKGRIITTSSACTSASQGIGYAYEAIKFGKQKVMIAGGAEELCVTEAAVFDTLYATSTKNNTPNLTPQPYDKDRDGLVLGEGAGTFILEELEHAKARGANIIAEVIGFGTNADGQHVTQPTAETMSQAIQLALQDADIPANEIGYVNGHGTATEAGDIAETQATRQALGRAVPISSLKSYLGHTLGACGAIEAWASIEMMLSGWFAPTINLSNIDPRCAELDYLTSGGRQISTDIVMSNNFAFGGINTSLIFKRWNE
ncbi:beta-ketoacyl-ACP synthase [Neptunicella sp. SCSIO 80796]|uniref:beta-ketoacyl-ACP synthase n=1 Tax=Neptunicella plasticusilytica TaxID=3117012 RepID=UPI003A4D7208